MDDSLAKAAFGSRRITAPRRAIAEAACGMSGAFTVEDLAEVTQAGDSKAGSVATVYRAVAAMEQSSFIERVGSRGGQALYARCGSRRHHHHVVCESCGRMAEADCPVDAAALTNTGFVVTRHEITLYGLCPACAVGMQD